MADFNIRSESVDVEQIMKQIRARLKEKRGVDYTEEQVRELATVRLEKFLDPKNLRSDLLEQFRKTRPALPEPPKEPPPVEAPYAFDDETLFQSHRGPLRLVRRLLKPILKLFFNPNTLNQILHTQAQFNVDMLKRDLRRRVEFQQQVVSFERSRGEWNVLYYEVLHNLVLETTRNGIELKNLKMRVEALASRLDFSERRVRALEGVVQYRPEAVRSPRAESRGEHVEGRDRDRESERARERAPRPEGNVANGDADEGAPRPTLEATTSAAAPAGPGPGAPSESGGRRRRRRRRGRRGAGLTPGAASSTGDQQTEVESAGGDEDFESGDEIGAMGEPDGSAAFEPGDSANAASHDHAEDTANGASASAETGDSALGESHDRRDSDAPSDPDEL